MTPIIVFVAIDSDGNWAAMGLSEAAMGRPEIKLGGKPTEEAKSLSDVHKQLTLWNLDENLGFCKIYRVELSVEPPTMEEVESISERVIVEGLGMLP